MIKSKFKTVGSLLSSFRLQRSPLSVYVDLGKKRSIGNFRSEINDRTVLQLLNLIDELGVDVFSDFGWNHFDLKWRTCVKYPRQCWSLAARISRNQNLLITDLAETCSNHFRNRWKLNYVAEYPKDLDRNDVIVPYSMSSNIRGSAKSCGCSPARKFRIFFAGSCGKKEYDRKECLNKKYGKETRFRLVQQLKSLGLLHEIKSIEDLDSALAGPPLCEFIFVDTSQLMVPSDRWLNILAQSDFFFSPPGTIFPMCHNIIEALSVGSIPITNYAEIFSPALEGDGNCLEFGDLQSLEHTIRHALDVKQDKIDHLRNGAITYYDSFLNPKNVASRLINRFHEPLTLHLLNETFGAVESLSDSCKD